MMPRLRIDNPWRLLWRLFTGDGLLAATLLALALALVLAAWLPQTSPTSAASDVVWQSEMQRRFGDVAWFNTLRPLLETVGVFAVARAVWFRLLLALLALCLLTRWVDAVEAWVDGLRGAGPPEEMTWHAVEGDWEGWLDRLGRGRLRVRVLDASAPGEMARVDRWPWAELGPVLVYLGALAVLLGVAVTATAGWRAGPYSLVAGESAALGHGSDLTLRLTALSADGQRGSGEIWRGEDRRVGAGSLAVGRPLSGGGITVHLVGRGTGLRVQATLSDTRPLLLVTGPEQEGYEELAVAFSADQPRHLVAVQDPRVNIVLLLSSEQPDAPLAPIRVQVYASGSGRFITEDVVSGSALLYAQDVALALTPVPYVQVRAVHDPGRLWGRLGALALLGGLALWGWRSPRRAWLRRQGAEGAAVEAAGDLLFYR